MENTFTKSFLALVLFLISAFLVLPTNAFPTTNGLEVREVLRGFYNDQTGDGLTQAINAYDLRITKLRVEDPNVPTFSASMVQNTGDFGTGWWWYYGIDGQTLGELLDGKRLISIDPYFTWEGLRFAVVMVDNTGTQGRAWWWYWGQSAAEVGQLLQSNNARLVELRPYDDNGELKFAVVMIANTGDDYRGWEWWYGESPDFIYSRIQTGLRVLTLAPDPFGNWATILVSEEGEGWYWRYGISAGQVIPFLEQDNTRLIDLSPYYDNGNLLYATVELDDNLGPQLGLK